ncbi:MAG: NfeD family protein [Proteobacteria bacterium]|nr:NfeD family protein [Pseudomonadota bacterium]
MDFSWIGKLDYWGWGIIGLIFVIIEVMVPGVLFLWLGLAAFAVGAVVLILPDISWQIQGLLFAVLSVVSALAGRAYLKRNPLQTEDANLNRRGHQYVGRTFTLDEPIVNGVGKLKVDDTTWKVEGDDIAAGIKVKVTGVDGVVLMVSAA